jgi:hypothetical protein
MAGRIVILVARQRPIRVIECLEINSMRDLYP